MRTRFGTFAGAVIAVTVLGVGASTSASSASASSPAQQAAAAKQALAPDLVAPTKLDTTPLPKAAPAGKTIVYLECDNTACTLDAQGIAAAAQVLGWTYKTIPFKLADPSTLISAMDSALQFKPYFVMETGVPEAAFAG